MKANRGDPCSKFLYVASLKGFGVRHITIRSRQISSLGNGRKRVMKTLKTKKKKKEEEKKKKMMNMKS